jgi:DNA-binding FadR family transcriptional regulator
LIDLIDLIISLVGVKKKMGVNGLNSKLLTYLVEKDVAPGDRLPPLAELALRLDLSIGKLREQLELARHLNLVSVRPRLGIHRERFDFLAAVRTSLIFALATGEATFAQFSALRQMIETNMWHEAVSRLTDEDKENLRQIVAVAWSKLQGDPPHIPNEEHRQLHLTIFSRLNNPFVQGLLAAYWEAYESSELTRYVEYVYWTQVWDYHSQIVEAICSGDHDRGLRCLVTHFSLLPEVPAVLNAAP